MNQKDQIELWQGSLGSLSTRLKNDRIAYTWIKSITKGMRDHISALLADEPEPLTFLGIPVKIDPSIPPGTVRFESGKDSMTVVNVAADPKPIVGEEAMNQKERVENTLESLQLKIWCIGGGLFENDKKDAMDIARTLANLATPQPEAPEEIERLRKALVWARRALYEHSPRLFVAVIAAADRALSADNPKQPEAFEPDGSIS